MSVTELYLSSGSLIHEGADGALIPEVVLVQQGGKAFFFKGAPNELAETTLLVEDTVIVESFGDLDLEEKADGTKVVKGGHWFVEGPFQRSDVANANKRRYPRKIWERIVADSKSPQQQTIKERGMIGHLEHPQDGRTDGSKGALITTSLQLRKDGVVWGTAEVLDTPNGKIVQEYIRKNVRWGVSSRGTGSVNAEGVVNEQDYNLVTFDAVMKPSTPGAFPKPKVQDKNTTEEVLIEEHGQDVLTDEAKALQVAVTELVEMPIEALDEVGRIELTSSLLARLGSVSGAVKEKSIPIAKADELRDWLHRKLGQVHAATQEVAIQTIIEGATEGETDEERQRSAGAFEQIVSRLQKTNSELAEQYQTLTDEAENTRAEYHEALSDREGQIELLRGQLDVALREAADIKAMLRLTEAKLDVSAAYIASLSEESEDERDEAGINTAVEAVLTEHPELRKFGSMLQEAADPGHVALFAEHLLPTVAPPTAASGSSRPALPAGLRVASDDGAAAPEPRPRSASRGARRAARALNEMKSRQEAVAPVVAESE